MIRVRRAGERGHANHGWLDTYHSFSFADYYDPQHMGFRALRVINDDRIGPGGGFPNHPHRDMEILTYVVEGALEHKDSMGNGSVIRPGDVQRMTAGTGVVHSEYNHSQRDPVRLLQIWILPERGGLEPSYEQKGFSSEERQGSLRLVASRDGADNSVTIHQDARVYATLLGPGEHLEHGLAQGRHVWLQVVRGKLAASGVELAQGDGLAVSEARAVELVAVEPAEALLFDLA